jgi:sortase A
MKRRAQVVAALLVAAGLLLLGRDAWLLGKAALAEVLISRAFAAHLDDGAPHRPWDWADTHPIARLEVPRLGVERFVLSGASGTSLAFGVGHVDGTAFPNTGGHTVLAGHRDTRLRFLRHLKVGDRLRVQTRGSDTEYVVESLRIVDHEDGSVLQPTIDDRITLLTCYPFDGLIGGPLRYAVTATRTDALKPASDSGRAAPPPSGTPSCSRA